LQIFCTSSFNTNAEVETNFLNAPVFSIAAVLGSPEKTRCSVAGKVADVNDFFYYCEMICQCIIYCHHVSVHLLQANNFYGNGCMWLHTTMVHCSLGTFVFWPQRRCYGLNPRWSVECRCGEFRSFRGYFYQYHFLLHKR